MPGAGRPMLPERSRCAGACERERRGLGRAEAGEEQDALAAGLDRELLQLVPDVLRQAGAGVEQHLQRG